MDDNFSYFKNNSCSFFPCHKKEGDFFNCLFCYCPLYTLGENCGGNFKYSEGNIKDCSSCVIPHSQEGYQYILSKFPQIAELAKKQKTD